MTVKKKNTEGGWPVDLLTLGFGGCCLYALVKVGLLVWDLVNSAIGFVRGAISTGQKMALILGCLLVAAFVIAAVLDLLTPIVARLKKRRAVRKAIARCSLPRLATFRGADSESKLDQWLAVVVLAPKYTDLSGLLPASNSFRGHEADFSLFRATELPRVLLGPFKMVVEQCVFSPIYEAYRAGENEKLVKWVNNAITAVKKRHPFRLVGRLVRITTFFYGFKSGGEGFKQETVEERGTDRQFIYELLWLHFWPNASLLESWVEFDFGLEDIPKRLPEPAESEEIAEVSPPKPLLLLPPPSEKSRAELELKEKQREEEKREAELMAMQQAELREDAVEAVKMVIERWETDNPSLRNPLELLDDDEEILRASIPFHPDSDLVYEQLAVNQTRRNRLDTFERDFENEMNTDTGEMPFLVPWLADAVSELDGQIQPERFRRLALRHYLNQTDIEAPNDALPGSGTDDDLPEDSNASVVSFPKKSPTPAAPKKQSKNIQSVEETSPPMLIPDGL